MKGLLIHLLIICACCYEINAQTFKVIRTAGIITLCESGDTLRVEDAISHDDSLCFVNTVKGPAVASIINLDNMVRYYIKSVDNDPGVQANLVYNCLNISRALTGTRRGELNSLLDISTYLGSGDFLIPGDTLLLQINPDVVAMNQDSFFYASYRYSGGDIPEAKLFTGEIINKRLSFSSDTLLLLASELYQVDSVQIRPEYADSFKLYYYRPGLKQRTLIAQFHPVFLDNNSTDQGLNLLSEIILQKQEAELEAERRKKDQWLKEQLSSYLLEIYGRTDKNQLDRWLDNFLQSKRN